MNNVNAGMKHNAARDSALQMLRSIDFFAILRGALRSLGLAGQEEAMGVGVFFAAVSRFQAYPLRVQVREQTEGTAAHILRKVEKLLPPESVVTLRPTPDEEWDRFTEAPNQKLVFVPEWTVDSGAGTTRLDVRSDYVIQRIPVTEEERVVEQFAEVHGRFACISVARPWEWGRHPRWLTMEQPSARRRTTGVTLTPRTVNTRVWHEVQRFLQARARLPIVLPEWEQIVVEQICDREDGAVRNIPALLQAWRTMCVIQSFQAKQNDQAQFLQATFDDLAAASLLGKKVFREKNSFPSCKRVFQTLAKPQNSTRAINPVTGKFVVYKTVEKEEEPTRWQPLF